jgi:CRP-like cAMP-binding protein
MVKPGTQIVFATLGTGQTLGEVSFFDGGNRSGIAYTRERTRLVRLPYEGLRALLAERPGLALLVYRQASVFLARHLRRLALEVNHRYF